MNTTVKLIIALRYGKNALYLKVMLNSASETLIEHTKNRNKI
jgi:hypothetical protein